MGTRRVVITGVGAVTPLGVGAEISFERLLKGDSGVAPITAFDAANFATRIAGECREYVPEQHFPKIESKKLDRFTQFALVAAKEALAASGVKDGVFDPTRAGVVIGSGIGGIGELEAQDKILGERGPDRVSPFFIPKMMMNAAAGQISIYHGLEGPNFATASACASASHAIGMALRAIQHDEADVMVAGGSEATVTPLAIGGFCALRAMSRRNDDPAGASRPFDKDRDGFVMGEGAAILVLEEAGRAQKRGARILAELCGYGTTADAHHITAPKEDGIGPARAMQIALRDGSIDPMSIDYVNAHGTSTEYNDVVETRALKAVFGDHARRLAISSSKSMIGHLLGAAGAIGAMVSTLSVARGVVHPTRNLTTADPLCDLDYLPGAAREMRVRAAICNALGFGGHNVCLAFRAFAG
ncbi:MAG: beta-ketoacyl-[acyl-carrier-protein] synthase II [Planctomycetes bacterium]|nr:beta-ketoacyl-[acyl-carrier-protein] synthase II [Planctomycetota bacterium]